MILAIYEFFALAMEAIPINEIVLFMASFGQLSKLKNLRNSFQAVEFVD